MEFSFSFFINSILFGIGLAMDAFSVSMANGLNEPKMKKGKIMLIAGMFSGFQIIMPLIGWICIRTVAQRFEAFQKLIPWIALILLLYIGGKMLIEGIRKKGADEQTAVGLAALTVQGIATSIDALSVGFTIADYTAAAAVTEAVIIGIVTFGICVGGVLIGKKFGTALSDKASVLGGVILIAIGLEIFIKGVFL